MKQNIKSRLKTIRYILTILFILIIVRVLMPEISTINEIETVLFSMPLWLVGLAVTAQVLSYIGSGYMLVSIMREIRLRLSILRGIMIVLSAASVGLVFGGIFGSSASTYYWATKSSKDSSKDSTNTVLLGILPTLYNSVVLTAVTCVGIAYLLLKHELSIVQLYTYGTILFIIISLIALVIFALINYEKIVEFLIKLGMTLNKHSSKKFDLERFKLNTGNLGRAIGTIKKKGLFRISLGSVINIAFDMLTLYIFFTASGHAVKPSVLIAGYSLAFLVTRAAIIAPGGIGIAESSMAAVFASLGVENHIAIVVVLSYRLVSFWIPSILGFIFIPFLNRESKANKLK